MKFEQIDFPKINRIVPAQFNLFFGPNESGKSQMAKALNNSLTQTRARKKTTKKSTDRANPADAASEINYCPEIILTFDNGTSKDIRPNTFDLAEHLKLNAESFSNLFFIQSSNLAFHNEANFYQELSGLLMGSQTDLIEKVLAKIRTNTHLTPTLQIINTVQDSMANSQMAIQQIADLQAQIEAEKFDDLELEEAEIDAKIAGLETQGALQNEAHQREIYDRVHQEYTEFLNERQELEKLRVFNQEDCNEWQGDQQNLTISQKALEEKRQELAGYAQKLKEQQAAFETKNISLDQVKEIKLPLEQLQNSVKDSLKHGMDLAAKRDQLLPMKKTGIWLIFLFVGLIFGAFAFPNAAYGYNLIPVSFGIVCLVFIYVFLYPLYLSIKIRQNREMQNQFLLEYAQYHIQTADITAAYHQSIESLASIQSLERECIRFDADIKNTQIIKAKDEADIQKIELELSGLITNIKTIQTKANVLELPNYLVQLKLNLKYTESVGNKRDNIQNLLASTPDESTWSAAIDVLAAFKDKSEGCEIFTANRD